jgi:hypothetical protein
MHGWHPNANLLFAILLLLLLLLLVQQMVPPPLQLHRKLLQIFPLVITFDGPNAHSAQQASVKTTGTTELACGGYSV